MRYTLIESKTVDRTTYGLVKDDRVKATYWITSTNSKGRVSYLRPYLKEDVAHRAWQVFLAFKEAKEA